MPHETITNPSDESITDPADEIITEPAEDTITELPVVVGSKLIRKFYEPITLLLSLNQTFKKNVAHKVTEVRCDTSHDAEDIFQGFVCKLSQLCDSRRRGFTVTSFVILQKPDKVQYVFASNQRSPVEMETTKAYIYSVLKTLGDAALNTEEEQDEASKRIFRDALIFNIDRVRRYLTGLAQSLEVCIAKCESEEAGDSALLLNKLRKLQKPVVASNKPNLDDDEFLDSMETTIKAIKEIQDSPTSILIQKRANDNSTNNTEPWREVRHHWGRLLSYHQAADVLLISRQFWPALFQNFEVIYIPSSKPRPNPLKSSPLSAATIIERMLNGEEKTKYASFAKHLPQAADLDAAVEAKWTSPRFRPYIHAEVLLLNWLENTGGIRPDRFFNRWRYIGCSKPTCRLCDYYFSTHGGGVKIRSAHGNLYANWSLPEYPDVEGVHGEEATRRRVEIMQGIVAHLRQEVLRILRDKIPGTRPNDSNDMSSLMLGGDRAVLVRTVRAQMGTLRTDVSVHSRSDWSSAGSEPDDDSDNGGHIEEL